MYFLEHGVYMFFMEDGVSVSCSMKKYTSYFRMVYVVYTVDCCAYII